MKKILYILPNLLVSSGVTSVVMNYYRKIDKSKFQIDFLVVTKRENTTEEELIKSGANIYYLKNKRKHYFKLQNELDNFFKNHKYDIVELHSPLLAFIFFKPAKKHNVKLRIVHAHSTIRSSNKIKNIFNKIFVLGIKRYANIYFACSNLSGKYWYKNKINTDKYKTIANGINVNDYFFNPEKRNQFRKELNIENNFVIGFVGRISKDKNLLFLMEIMEKLVSIDKEYKLVVVGDGKELQTLKERSKSFKDNIIFLGLRNDVKDILSCFDILVLPSKKEGLPMVAVEAQCSDIPCFLSDTITDEVNIGKAKFIPLKAEKWVDEIVNFKTKDFENIDIDRTKFDIEICTKKLEDIYEYYLKNEV